MNHVNGVLRDLYLVFLLLAVWEIAFGHDLLYQPARVALAAISGVLILAIPYRGFLASGELTAASRVPRPPQGGLPRTEKITTSGTIRGYVLFLA